MSAPGVIALITGGTVRHAMTMQCIERLHRPTGSRVEVICGGCDVTENRNVAVECLLATDGAWLLQIDDDVLFGGDSLVRLLKHFRNPEVEVVSPLILRRSPPHLSTLCDIRDGSRLHHRPIAAEETGLIRVGAVGGGFMLTRREVFERVQAPWFQCGRVRPDRLHEDVAFCSRLTGVYCDLDVAVGHIGSFAVWPRRRVIDGCSVRDVELQFVRGEVGELEAVERCAALCRDDEGGIPRNC